MNDSAGEYPALLIGTDIFGGGGLSSRLGDRVRQEEGLSYGVGAFFAAQSLDERATLGIYAIMNPLNINKVEQAISEELHKLLADGVTDDEFAAARNGWLESQKNDRSDDSTLTRMLNSTLEASRDMSYYAGVERRVQSLTAQEVSDAWRRHIDPDRIPVAVAGDMSKAQAAPASSGEGK
jgi:zinc protease